MTCTSSYLFMSGSRIVKIGAEQLWTLRYLHTSFDFAQLENTIWNCQYLTGVNIERNNSTFTLFQSVGVQYNMDSSIIWVADWLASIHSILTKIISHENIAISVFSCTFYLLTEGPDTNIPLTSCWRQEFVLKTSFVS